MAKGTTNTDALLKTERHGMNMIEERIEAGLILLGSEVKSLRHGRASIAESYAGEIAGVWFCSILIFQFTSRQGSTMSQNVLANYWSKYENAIDAGFDPPRGDDTCATSFVLQ